MPEQTATKLNDAQGYLDRVIAALRAFESPEKATLIGVLQYLSDHIRATRAEIGALRPGAGAPLFSDTADELEEIVSETARAANRIMDAAETIETVATSAEPAMAAALRDAATNIYEASAFQDITGQRITKVVRALQSLEEKLGSLVGAFAPPAAGAPLADPRTGDAALLNGPQLSANVNGQAEIDALFASLDAVP